jgi:F-type H+-transporting ATPase subunit delta
MGSASREALSRAQAVLTAQGKQVSVSVGAELLDASAVIASSSTLRSAVADNVVDAKIKQKLVAGVFKKASKPTRMVLDEVAANRWSHPDDVVDALENLGIRAEAMVAKTPLDEELLAINEVISSSNDLELTLGSKLGDSSAKGQLANAVFAGNVSTNALLIVTHLVQNARGRRIGAMLKAAATIVADQGGYGLANVTVAQPLAAASATRLEKTLAKDYGRPIKLNFIIDPAVIGGMRIQIGDDVIDGSVASRLKELRLKLAS